MKTLDSLKLTVLDFADLKRNWDTYGAEPTTMHSIITANNLLDFLNDIVDINTIDVFPMRDGGVQIDIGEFVEFEVFNDTTTKVTYNAKGKLLSQQQFNLYLYNNIVISQKYTSPVDEVRKWQVNLKP